MNNTVITELLHINEQQKARIAELESHNEFQAAHLVKLAGGITGGGMYEERLICGVTYFKSAKGQWVKMHPDIKRRIDDLESRLAAATQVESNQVQAAQERP